MNDIKLNIVIVLRSGGDYGMLDVFTLSNHLHNYNPGIQIYCLTDFVKTEIRNVKEVIFLPMFQKYPGWWAKMNLFTPDIEWLRPFLYFDLDTIVLGKIDSLIPSSENIGKLITLEDFYRPSRCGSAVMWIPRNSAKVTHLWDYWNTHFNKVISQYRGDQDYIETIGIDLFFQSFTNIITSFKPKRKVLLEQPKDKSIVCLHGKPRLWEAARKIQWVHKYVKE